MPSRDPFSGLRVIFRRGSFCTLSGRGDQCAAAAALFAFHWFHRSSCRQRHSSSCRPSSACRRAPRCRLSRSGQPTLRPREYIQRGFVRIEARKQSVRIRRLRSDSTSRARRRCWRTSRRICRAVLAEIERLGGTFALRCLTSQPDRCFHRPSTYGTRRSLGLLHDLAHFLQRFKLDTANCWFPCRWPSEPRPRQRP